MAPPRTIPTRAVAAWVLYDLANTIFSMGVASTFFAAYVRDAVGAARADGVLSLVNTISMTIILVVSPMLGAMTDRARRRMPFLVWSTIGCCVMTALIARGPFALSAACFAIANVLYQAGLQFYDALLPDVSTEENRGRISGIGVGIGYMGSFVAIGLGFVIADKPTIFAVIAVLFLVFAVPCFFLVHERGNPNPRPVLSLKAIAASTSHTIATLRSSAQYPGLLRFLIGRVFYTDAVNTVIVFMFLYVVNASVAAGLDKKAGEGVALNVMAIAIGFAVVGGVVWGRIVDRIGPKRTLNQVLALWVATFLLAASVGLIQLPPLALYLVAIMAGIAMGGTWAADRPYMLRLTPPDRIGEFYGLYGMVGRFSAVTGPILWWIVVAIVQRAGGTPLTGQAMAIITLLGMVIASYVILKPVNDRHVAAPSPPPRASPESPSSSGRPSRSASDRRGP
jgi:UMF1 family MFS transporter